jgi:hypothetical protein
LRKSFTERNTSFGGRNLGSLEVVAAMEREREREREREGGREEKKEKGRKSSTEPLCPEGRLCPEGTSEGASLLSTVAWDSLPCLQTRAPARVAPSCAPRVHLAPYSWVQIWNMFPWGLFVNIVFQKG